MRMHTALPDADRIDPLVEMSTSHKLLYYIFEIAHRWREARPVEQRRSWCSVYSVHYSGCATSDLGNSVSLSMSVSTINHRSLAISLFSHYFDTFKSPTSKYYTIFNITSMSWPMMQYRLYVLHISTKINQPSTITFSI